MEPWLKFKASFEKFIVQDIKKALLADIEVGTFVLTAIGIECLSGYFAGKPSDNNTFQDFIKAFMPEYHTHALSIYKCIRNGLAHDYIIKENLNGKSYIFTRNQGENHLIPVQGKPGWYYFNREQFALDFLEAQEMYFRQVGENQQLLQKALMRLSERRFLDVFSIHPTTTFMDSNERFGEIDISVTGTFARNH